MNDGEKQRIQDLIDVLDELIMHLEETRMYVFERIRQDAKNVTKEELNAALAEAAYQCLPDVVKVLIEAGADVNLRWDFDRTPLHNAALSNKGAECAEVADILIRAGADVNAVDEFDMTPLHYAALFSNVKVAES
jgi:ankyrin repeat protein